MNEEIKIDLNLDLIEKYIEDNNLIAEKFCKMCNISLATYKRIKSGENTKLNSIIKIARTIGVELTQMFLN